MIWSPSFAPPKRKLSHQAADCWCLNAAVQTKIITNKTLTSNLSSRPLLSSSVGASTPWHSSQTWPAWHRAYQHLLWTLLPLFHPMSSISLLKVLKTSVSVSLDKRPKTLIVKNTQWCHQSGSFHSESFFELNLNYFYLLFFYLWESWCPL